MELCELASKEQAEDKLAVLFEDILRLLEDKQARLDRIAVDGMPHDTAAST